MTMDYSPLVEREIWLFLKVTVSPKLERSCPPKLVCMYVISTPICMIFWANSDRLNFLMTMDEREIWPFLKVAVALKLERSYVVQMVS